jgi:phage shock protein C
MNRRLYRSDSEKVLGGVAGGVAEYLDADPSIVRVIWAVLALITGGVFFVLYIVMWIVVPFGPESELPVDAAAASGGEQGGEPGAAAPAAWNARPARRRSRGSGGGSWIVGTVLIGLGLYFLAREYVTWLDVNRLWPLGLVVLGVLLLLVAIRRRPV